jgi:hypothetical protein
MCTPASQTSEEDAALIAYADVDGQNSYADAQFRQAAASGIPLHGYRLDFLAYRGTKDARLAMRLCMALFEAAGRPVQRGAPRVFSEFLQGRGRQRRT